MILIAEDDPDDQLLLQNAFQENGVLNTLDFVTDGLGLLYYLNTVFESGAGASYPDFIMLDLNMPRMNGQEALHDLKQHPVFRKIPVIVYTTNNDELEVRKCYDLGANTYIVKPSSFHGMVETVRTVLQYWLSTAAIPKLTGAA